MESKEYWEMYYAKNKEKIKTRSMKYYEENPEKHKAATNKWREENPEKSKAATKKWREDNKDRIKAQVKQYRLDNIEILKANAKKIYAKNPLKVYKNNLKYRENKRKQFIQWQVNWWYNNELGLKADRLKSKEFLQQQEREYSEKYKESNKLKLDRRRNKEKIRLKKKKDYEDVLYVERKQRIREYYNTLKVEK